MCVIQHYNEYLFESYRYILKGPSIKHIEEVDQKEREETGESLRVLE